MCILGYWDHSVMMGTKYLLQNSRSWDYYQRHGRHENWTTIKHTWNYLPAADCIWQNFSLLHRNKQIQCLLPLTTLLTATDCSIVANHIWSNGGSGHHLEQTQGLLPFSKAFTGGDGCTVSDDIRRYFCHWHGGKQAYGQLPFCTAGTCTDGHIVAHNMRFNSSLHLLKKMHGLLPFSSLSASTHGGIVAEDVRLKCCFRNGGENPAGLLPELGPAAGWDSKGEVMAVQGAGAVSTTHSFQQLKNLFLGGCWWDGGGTTQIKLKMGLTLSKKMCIYIYITYFFMNYICVYLL